MRIISERALREFWDAASGNERSVREKAMREWTRVVRGADWNSFAELKHTFNHSDVYGDCTVFDIGGNKYRIIAKVIYRKKLVFIRTVLTHADYDKKRWQTDCK
jgi:mRNA interferase HigB